MRVLILSPDIYTRGGIARYTATLASAFGDLVGPDNVHVQPLLGAADTAENFRQFQVLSPVSRRLTIAGKFRFAGRAIGEGRRKYDLMVCTHIGLSPVAALIRLLFGTPFWTVCHGSEAWSRFPVDVRWAIRRAGVILPVSLFTLRAASEANGIPQSRMRVLYNAIPDNLAAMLTSSNGTNGCAAASNGKEKHILSVGVVAREFAYKGYDTVIKALPKVLQSVSKVRYVVAGEGDDIDRLKDLACEVGVQDRVEFKGGISDADLAACYRACDVFVLPSRASAANGDSYGEGFGRVYVEAALAGKPVVGSVSGGAAEAVLHQKTGLLVDPTSVDQVAGAISMLLRNPERAARMGHAGYRWASKNFSEASLRSELSLVLREGGYLQ